MNSTSDGRLVAGDSWAAGASAPAAFLLSNVLLLKEEIILMDGFAILA